MCVLLQLDRSAFAICELKSDHLLMTALEHSIVSLFTPQVTTFTSMLLVRLNIV